VQAYGEKQRIEEALRLAHDIQMAMLPRERPAETAIEIEAELRPARSVGGDLYDFFVERGRLWFLVGDVAGKGVGPALFMAVAETLFRASVHGDTPLAVVFSRMNRELCRKSSGAMFVTVFAGCLDLATGDVEIANAGHNPPYRLGRDGSVTKVTEPRGVPLGVLDAFDFPTGRLRLAPGEALYIYTDGVTEALDAREDQFGTERLEGYLAGAAGRPVGEIVRGTLRAVQEFEAGASQYDDITVLCVRYRGAR
jgi:sigma-B regulation protein RsbU (phosphoserine phosphatase)